MTEEKMKNENVEMEREAARDFYRSEGYDPDTIEEFIRHDERLMGK